MVKVKVGDRIRIIRMAGESHYNGKDGVIQQIGRDPWGDEYWRGSWGGLSVYPSLDDVEIIGQ